MPQIEYQCSPILLSPGTEVITLESVLCNLELLQFKLLFEIKYFCLIYIFNKNILMLLFI